MDVHCTTCGEPWDTDHLMHDAIHDTQLPDEEVLAWKKLPFSERFNAHISDEFFAAGWRFGRTLLNVTRCPACPPEASPNPDQLHLKAELEEMLAGDEDGLIVENTELDL